MSRNARSSRNEPADKEEDAGQRAAWSASTETQSVAVKVTERADCRSDIEVKGRQGSIVCAEITPNEHQAMHSVKYRNRYVLYVVTDALVNPVASIFQFDKKQNVWSSEDGRKLKIVLKTGSIVNA